MIDTNLVILFGIGTYNPARISTFNRTRKFARSDFDLLTQIRRWFQTCVTTPNILTEVDDLVRQLPEAEHQGAAATMRGVIDSFLERVIASTTAVNGLHYARYGLADAISVAVAREDFLVMTDDFPLTGLLAQIGRAVVNFNHLRSFR